MKNTVKFTISLITCLAAGFLGSFFTRSSLESWYLGLKKPFFNPPSWVFAPVWTILYIMMGVSAFIVWRKGLKDRMAKLAIAIFIFQLLLNFLWSPAFFGMRSPGAALAVIIFLWQFILLTMLLFYRISISAFVLLIPYIAWVSFAVILNLSIFLLNRAG